MEGLANRLFEFLFKYRPVVFDRGDLALGMPWPLWFLIGALTIVGLTTLLSYSRVRGRLVLVDRVALVAFRCGIFAIVFFCLTRPMLIVATVVPQENFLGILLDDSRSMGITDGNGAARSRFVAENFGSEGSELANALSDRFKLRFFRFSESLERIANADALEYQGNRTRLGSALEGVSSELSAVPLAGLVVFTDGADNSDKQLTETILQLRGRGVPVHTVGLGSERFERDLEIARVETPRSVLEGASVAVDVTVFHPGFSGDSIQLDVEDGGSLVGSQRIELSRIGETTNARVFFTATEIGARVLNVRVEHADGEQVAENNSRETLIVVKNNPQRILYIEGEPRFEIGHLRRAIADDENVHVVFLIVTAEDKYYRLNVGDENEVVSGFPFTREELFKYSAIILGSIEASHFTHDQLEMITEFVGERGGGLLALGGRRSFAEGGYIGTPVENVLPVEMSEPNSTDSFPPPTLLKVELTPFGDGHPITQLAETSDSSALRWGELPQLSAVNRISETKPGASTLLLGLSESDERLVVLATQRYGRGRSVALTVQDSWLWQMHADIPVDDLTHETFWRQLLRWLVSSVPDRVTASVGADRADELEPVTVTAEVSDSAFLSVNNAQVTARVTNPLGEESVIPLEWTVERDGEYSMSFTPETRGVHDIVVNAEADGEPVGVASTFVHVAESVEEYFDAEMQGSALRRIAEETGGGYYTPATVNTLPEDVRFTESGSTVHEELDLWDMPVVFLVVLALLSSEWGYRRWRGLV